MQAGRKLIVSCSYCRRNISNHCRIRCADPVCNDSSNGPFDLCSDCFCSGAELKPHENSHAYQVIDSLEFPVFSKDWSANDELLMLEGTFKINLIFIYKFIF